MHRANTFMLMAAATSSISDAVLRRAAYKSGEECGTAGVARPALPWLSDMSPVLLKFASEENGMAALTCGVMMGSQL